ncbi:hypothetical protein [Clostridium sp. ZBS4]|uniref:polysaccharide deacetylase WbmS family protein n=1 Tax=Clostridium sp. ZBS4 TaxID=2949974 RepID=UPI00207998A2|nr:hypothetical protein [Clostridium sp. ZBS4]
MEDILKKLEKFRNIIKDKTIISFTSDIDWASDYAINRTIEYFEENSIPVTMFLTHPSKAIDNALQEERIKVGLHPNFMPDSSQGKNYDEIIDYCFNLYPNAIGYRGHRYYDVNDTIEKLVSRGIKFDSNVCTLLDNVYPFLHRSNIIRFPIFWEDGAYLYQYKDINFANVKKKLFSPGLKIINIHPMHLMLNTPYFKYTREIKDTLSREEWNNLSEETIDKLSYKGYGIKNVIDDMVKEINDLGTEVMYLEDVYNIIMKQ